MSKTQFTINFPSYTTLLIASNDIGKLTDILDRSTWFESEYDPRDDKYERFNIESDKQIEVAAAIDILVMTQEDWEHQKEVLLEMQKEAYARRDERAIDTGQSCEKNDEDEEKFCRYDPEDEDRDRDGNRRCIDCRNAVIEETI